MTAGWVLPRDWDAARLLRFLTGLAMLALAFAANAGLIATPVDVAPAAPVSVTTAVDVPAVDEAPAPAPASQPLVTFSVIEIRVSVPEPVAAVAPAGPVGDAHGSRAPPAV